MSAGGYAIGKKMVENASKYNLRDALGMGRKIVGARWKQASTRQGRSALLARSAVGAMGGAAYGYTQGDWKGGAMMGAGAGAGSFMIGGRSGLRSMGVKGGFLKRSSARTAAAKKQVSKQVSIQVANTQMYTGDAMTAAPRLGAHPGGYRSSPANFAAADTGQVYTRSSVVNGTPQVNGAVAMNEALNGALHSRSGGGVVTHGSHSGMGLRQKTRNWFGRFNRDMTSPV